MGWIKCSDCMPEKYKEVLVCSDDGSRYIAALNHGMTWDDGYFFDDIQNITYWQPLPEPPAT